MQLNRNKIMKKRIKWLFWSILFPILILLLIFAVSFDRATSVLETSDRLFPEPQFSSAETSFEKTPYSAIAPTSPLPTLTPRILSKQTATPTPVEIVLNTKTSLPDNFEEQEPAATPTDTDLLQYDLTANPFSIGYSVEDRLLEMYHFGDGADHRLIIAGIHGGYEYNTTNLAYELIAYIQDDPSIIPNSITLYILPSLNPDGLNRSYGYAGRANANNVDLNRNWDIDWKTSWNPIGCWHYLEISGGEFAHSEPEVQALDSFINEFNISTIISYHSAALGIFPGFYPNHSPSISLAESISSYSPYPYPPISTGCEMTGQFVDYTARNGFASVDIELTNHKDSDFLINKDILNAFLQWQYPHRGIAFRN